MSATLANVRDRSRTARERSKSLRVTSQQLRESLQNLRTYAAQVHQDLPEQYRLMAGAAVMEHFSRPQILVDFAGLLRERVYRARTEAQALRRRAADLRHQAAEFRARAKNQHSGSSTL